MLKGKVALVTGSSSGIGRAVVIKLASLGCRVVIHGRDIGKLREVYSECNEITKCKNIAVGADLCTEEGVDRLLSEVIGGYGQLDILVNNAGLFTPADSSDSDAFKVYQRMMKTNLDSAVMLTLKAIPHLKKTKGCIVNISSNLHKVCLPGSFAYSTAKAGLTMFTKCIAVDLAPEVRVNSVSPGPVASGMPQRNGQDVETFRRTVGASCLINRVGEPDEIARLVVFLCSPESAFITGSDFIIDGGSTIKPAGKIMGSD